jgi:hypothetical protein
MLSGGPHDDGGGKEIKKDVKTVSGTHEQPRTRGSSKECRADAGWNPVDEGRNENGRVVCDEGLDIRPEETDDEAQRDRNGDTQSSKSMLAKRFLKQIRPSR